MTTRPARTSPRRSSRSRSRRRSSRARVPPRTRSSRTRSSRTPLRTRACVYGDNAYGTGSFHDRLDQAGIADRCKTQTPTAAGGLFSKDRFDINLDADTVTCPARSPRRSAAARAGGGTANFASACPACPLRAQCTNAAGAHHSVGPYEQTLTDARARQTTRTGSRRLPRQPAQGRTQARAPDAPPATAADEPGSEARPSRRRLQAAGRRHQPRPARRARPALDQPKDGRWRQAEDGQRKINQPTDQSGGPQMRRVLGDPAAVHLWLALTLAGLVAGWWPATRCGPWPGGP